MLKVEDWAEIRRLYLGEKMSIRAIARQLDVSRNTVRKAIGLHSPPSYERPPRGSAVDEFEAQIRELLKECPTMPATVIADRIGWQRGITVLKERVAEIRPYYLPQNAFQRTHYEPGKVAQWDLWLPPVDIPVGFDQTEKLWVVTGVSGYSRVAAGHMIPSRQTHDVLGGHLECLKNWKAVPQQSVYDNEGAIGRNRGGKMHFTHEFLMFKGTLGMGAYILRGAFPQGKGMLERNHRYYETSFLPGRTFTGIEDFNSQFKSWLATKANRRLHATIRCRPSDRWAEDKAAMLPLPPILPDVRFHTSIRLGQDHYVRVDTCDYSVHPSAIGRKVTITADLQWVVVTVAGREVARHKRSLSRNRVITDPVHGRARQLMREGRQAALSRPADEQVAERDLGDYDRALGVTLS